MNKKSSIVVFLLTVIALGAAGYWLAPAAATPIERNITIRARQYAYNPSVLRVNKGDTLRLTFISEDVVHGFYLEGYDTDVTINPLEKQVRLRRPSQGDQHGGGELVDEVVIVADREGKYRYRCSQTCGMLHPFMLGELVVGPNRLFPTSLGMTGGVVMGSLLVVVFGKKET